jgi:hypothetical protein
MHPVYTGLIYSKVGREDFAKQGEGKDVKAAAWV